MRACVGGGPYVLISKLHRERERCQVFLWAGGPPIVHFSLFGLNKQLYSIFEPANNTEFERLAQETDDDVGNRGPSTLVDSKA